MNGLEAAEVPNAHVKLIVEGEHIGEGFEEFSGDEVTTMLFVLSCVSFHQGNIQRIHIDGGTKSIGKYVAAELTSVVNTKHTFLVLWIDGRTGLLCHMLHCN